MERHKNNSRLIACEIRQVWTNGPYLLRAGEQQGLAMFQETKDDLWKFSKPRSQRSFKRTREALATGATQQIWVDEFHFDYLCDCFAEYGAAVL